MKLKIFGVLAFSMVTFMSSTTANAACPDLLDHSVRRLAGEQVDRLCEVYQGQVVMVVNTASKCGFTSQFEGLEALYQKYRDRGFSVIGFPSQDFGGQEFASEADAQEFCTSTYGVKFPMYATTHAKKGKADPLFEGLANAADGDYPSWNFHKYIIDRNGQLVGSYGSFTGPSSGRIRRVIESALDG